MWSVGRVAIDFEKLTIGAVIVRLCLYLWSSVCLPYAYSWVCMIYCHVYVFVRNDRQQSVAASSVTKDKKMYPIITTNGASIATQTQFICHNAIWWFAVLLILMLMPLLVLFLLPWETGPQSITIICLIQSGLLIEFQIAQFCSNTHTHIKVKMPKFIHPLTSYGPAMCTPLHMNNILAIFLW